MSFIKYNNYLKRPMKSEELIINENLLGKSKVFLLIFKGYIGPFSNI